MIDIVDVCLSIASGLLIIYCCFDVLLPTGITSCIYRLQIDKSILLRFLLLSCEEHPSTIIFETFSIKAGLLNDLFNIDFEFDRE